MAAATAVRRFLGAPDVLVEPDAELRRPLEDVEELSERQPEERADHRDRVEDREERVGVALHPGVAGGEHQPGEADGEEQDQRQEVFGEPLNGRGALLAHAPPHGQHHARDHQERRPDQAVEQEEPEERVVRKAERREAERDRLVQREIAGNRSKVQPAEDQRKGDGDGEQAAPHDEHVGEPAQPIPREDEAIAEHVERRRAGPTCQRCAVAIRAGRTPASRAASTCAVGGRCSHIA